MLGKQLLTNSRHVLVLPMRRSFGGRIERVTFAMSKLAKSLEKAGIDYCVMGGNALHAHGFERATTTLMS